MKLFATLLEVAGFVAVATAGFFVCLPVGLAGAGGSAIAVGYLLDRR